jgi:hypothetical protein
MMTKNPSKLKNSTRADLVSASQASWPLPLRQTHMVHSGYARFLAGVLSLAIVFSGCAVGPNYKRQTVDAPTDFRSAE